MVSVPECFHSFQGYNKPESRKKSKRDEHNLKCENLLILSNSLFTLAGSSYMKTAQWKAMYEAVLHLANSLRMYATYLQEKNAQMKEHHEKRSRINDVDEWQYLSGKEGIFPGPSARYCMLHLELEKSQPYTPVFLNDHLPSDPRRKYEYLKGIIVPFILKNAM